jgi:hypothetical protein
MIFQPIGGIALAVFVASWLRVRVAAERGQMARFSTIGCIFSSSLGAG